MQSPDDFQFRFPKMIEVMIPTISELPSWLMVLFFLTFESSCSSADGKASVAQLGINCYISTYQTRKSTKLASPACGKRVPATFQAISRTHRIRTSTKSHFRNWTYANYSSTPQGSPPSIPTIHTTSPQGDRGLHPLQMLFGVRFLCPVLWWVWGEDLFTCRVVWTSWILRRMCKVQFNHRSSVQFNPGTVFYIDLFSFDAINVKILEQVTGTYSEWKQFIMKTMSIGHGDNGREFPIARSYVTWDSASQSTLSWSNRQIITLTTEKPQTT